MHAALLPPLLIPPRQINEFVKRVRAFRIHLLIIGHIKKHMPAMFGKDKAARKMLEQLPQIFFQVRRRARDQPTCARAV